MTTLNPVAAATDYRERNAKRRRILIGTVLFLLCSCLIDISIGPGDYALSELLKAFFQPDASEPIVKVVLWDYRLPIAITAVMVGMMLGTAGAGMQTILNNPLADPFVLGISAAASMGAAIVIVTGWSLVPGLGSVLLAGNAFIFAFGASLLLFMMTRIRGVSSLSMILIGIAIMFICNAMVGLMQYRATDTQLAQIIFWIMGDITRVGWGRILVCLIALLVAIPYFLYRSWALTTLRLGDERAINLGIPVSRIRLESLLFVSLLASLSVAFVGAIGFIGLVGPHIARLLIGDDQRFFMPVSALTSACILSVASILSRSIAPGIIYPIGIITSLIGVPFFISLVMSSRKSGLS